jgi:hypothetical protein
MLLSRAVTCQGTIQGINPRGEVEVDPLYSWSGSVLMESKKEQAITQLGRTAALRVGGFRTEKGRIWEARTDRTVNSHEAVDSMPVED